MWNNRLTLMKPKTKRKVQLLIALLIFCLAGVASYFSIVETQGSNTAGYEVYLVLDISGSMTGEKIEALKSAAREFLTTLSLSSSNIRVGIVVYSSDAQQITSLTKDMSNLRYAIQSLNAGGSTALGDGVKIAVDHLKQEGNSSLAWVIVLMTDGGENNSHLVQPPVMSNAANYAAQNHVTVDCIGFGGDVREGDLRDMASRTQGKYYFASTGSQLINIFGQVAQTFVSPVLHYGSRILMLVAIPLVLFLPELERGASTVIRAFSTTILKRPPGIKGIRCPECGRLNRLDAKFCGSCQTPLITGGKKCPRCGYSNRHGARFCANCRFDIRELMEDL
jgi:uncharacterized protein YegL